MAHLWTLIADAASADTALYLPGDDVAVGLPDLLEAAERTSGQVLAAFDGRAPRRLGILMANGEPWVRGLMAAARLDAAAVPLPLPVAFAGAHAYLAHLRRIADDAGLDGVLVDSSLRRAITSAVTSTLADVTIIDITERSSMPAPASVPASDQGLAVVQYTSGSTSAPKGVTLTHRNVAHGLATVAEGLGMVDGDAFGLWVPLYHDMGLFCMLGSLARGSSVCLWRPRDFVRRPMQWLQSFARSPATVLAAPNFCYDLLVSAADGGIPAELDLSDWRLACNGAEPVQRRTLESFQRTFGPYGLREGALNPVYGMAEATLIVSGPDTAALWTSVQVDRDRLGVGQQVCIVDGASTTADARTVVSCGFAAPGLRLRVADAGAQVLADGVVGEVQITGPAVTGGYLHAPADGQPFTGDGWLRTGDLAFLLDSELYLVGRLKDMIAVRGQNYYAEDVEEIVRTTPGVHGRNAAVPWTDGDTERMAVLLETSLDADAAVRLAVIAHDRVVAHLGLDAVDVIPVAPATIPHTTSGKVQRKAARLLVRDAGRGGESPVLAKGDTP